MPAYPIPNWLHGPPDPAQILLHSHQIGAQIAEANARLQQQSQLEQIRLDIQQEQEERQSRQKDQQLEVEKAYHEQLTSLKQKELEEAQQRIDQQAKVAGQKYAAQQRIQQRISAGEDPDRVYLEEGAMAGASMSGLSGFARDMRMANAPKDIQAGQVLDASGIPIPGMAAFGGKPRNLPRVPAPKLSEQDHFEAVDLTKQIEKMSGELQTKLDAVDSTNPDEQLKLMPLRDRLLGLKKQRNQLFQKASPAPGASPALPTAPGAAPGPIPLPKTEKELLEGQVYQTTKGLGMWDASQKKFKLMPPEQSAPTQEPAPPEDPEHPPDEE